MCATKPLFRFSNGEIVVEQVPGVFLRQMVDHTEISNNFKEVEEVVDNTKVVEEVPGVIGRKGDLVRVGHRWVVAGLCQQEGCPERGTKVVRGCEGTWPRAKLPVSQVKDKEEKKDHEALAESLILQREIMRHLTDWFYPDGGWGWVVVFVAILVNLVAVGPLLGSGQVDQSWTTCQDESSSGRFSLHSWALGFLTAWSCVPRLPRSPFRSVLIAEIQISRTQLIRLDNLSPSSPPCAYQPQNSPPLFLLFLSRALTRDCPPLSVAHSLALVGFSHHFLLGNIRLIHITLGNTLNMIHHNIILRLSSVDN